MIIHQLANSDQILRRNDSILVHFEGKRKVLSSSPHNGGCQDQLSSVFIHCAEREKNSMRGNNYAEHIALLATELGLDKAKTCGISTGAYAENAAISLLTFEELTVTALATAGIDINGSRAGDPAQWHERAGHYQQASGTINIILHLNCNLSDGAMARAFITCTEAKTVAVSELAAPSRYSSGLATGSGTDGLILVCDPQAELTLTEAGNHFKLGELIAQTVIAAVKQALANETGLTPERQFNFSRRLERYGIDEDRLFKRWQKQLRADKTSQQMDKQNEPRQAAYLKKDLQNLLKQEEIVMLAILFAHLLDQLSWQLVGKHTAIKAAEKLLSTSISTQENECYQAYCKGNLAIKELLLDSLERYLFGKLEFFDKSHSNS